LFGWVYIVLRKNNFGAAGGEKSQTTNCVVKDNSRQSKSPQLQKGKSNLYLCWVIIEYEISLKLFHKKAFNQQKPVRQQKGKPDEF